MEAIYPGFGVQCINMFNATSAPIIATLANEYTIFDKWYASMPG
jgi:hypothetical protein